jgi:hypothetical protein
VVRRRREIIGIADWLQHELELLAVDVRLGKRHSRRRAR